MSFQIDELKLKDSSNSEQVRARKIFEVLKQKAINNETLTEHEKEFFCLAVKISLLNDGTLEDYPCCDNYKFKYLYLTYFRDLSGGISYQKVKGTSLYKVEINEVQADLQYLYDKAGDWDKIVLKTNHPDQLLQQILSGAFRSL